MKIKKKNKNREINIYKQIKQNRMSLLVDSSSRTSSNGVELETEIRKLKLELLKEELDDKILTFREYLEKKQRQNIMQFNQTNTTATTTQENSDRLFSSILFAPVVGDFEVWHFVFLIFFCWIFLSNFFKIF